MPTETATTTRPEEWRGSDLRSRTEVVQYLADRGGEIVDKSGLIVGTMREDLGRGRALAQLLAEMEQDGMIEREVRGRRTFRLTLVNDWDLVAAPRPYAVPDLDDAVTLDGVDLTALAETLLAVVVKRITSAPTTERSATATQVRQAERRAEKAEAQLRAKSEEATALRAELDQAKSTVRALENNLALLERRVREMPVRSKRREVPLGELLGDEGRESLAALMRALPESPTSKARGA